MPELPLTVCLSPDRLRRMATDMLHLASLIENLQQRELPYRVDGGLVMSTTSRGDTGGTTTFSIHGTLDVHVPRATQEAVNG